MKRLTALCAVIALLCGCNSGNSDSRRFETEPAAELTAESVETEPSTAEPVLPLSADDIDPRAVPAQQMEGSRISYTVEDVYSGGEYYAVSVSGARLYEDAKPSPYTAYIGGELYGDFRLELLKNGEVINSLKINLPPGDRFLILESVLDDLSYGFSVLSDKREFGSDEFPDLIQLDFMMSGETEVPQYARFFTVSEESIIEVPVYENGKETAPYGTHLEQESAGVMVQHIVAREYGSFTVKKYTYTFDTDRLCLNRERVRFYGYKYFFMGETYD